MKGWSAVWAAVAAAMGCAGITGACSVYDEALLGGGGGGGGEGPSCEVVTWPEPPSGNAGGGDIEIVAALTYFDLGEQYSTADQVVPPRNVGFDLDNMCTTNAELPNANLNDPSSCRHPAWISAPKVGDLEGGRDNGLRHVIQSIAGVFPGFGTPTYNQAIQEGKVSLVVQIKGYNGEENDDAVDIAVYTTGPYDHDNSGRRPEFKGEDEWPITSSSYINKDRNRPRLLSRDGYVRDGVLVGTMGDMDFRMKIGVSNYGTVDLNLDFRSTFFTARLVNDNGVWRLEDGNIAARWPTEKLLGEVKRFPDPLDRTKKVCTNHGAYSSVKHFICDAADIDAVQGASRSACGAVSVGIGFTAVQARLGPMVEQDELQNECGIYDPGIDNCDTAGAPDAGAPVNPDGG